MDRSYSTADEDKSTEATSAAGVSRNSSRASSVSNWQTINGHRPNNKHHRSIQQSNSWLAPMSTDSAPPRSFPPEEAASDTSGHGDLMNTNLSSGVFDDHTITTEHSSRQPSTHADKLDSKPQHPQLVTEVDATTDLPSLVARTPPDYFIAQTPNGRMRASKCGVVYPSRVDKRSLRAKCLRNAQQEPDYHRLTMKESYIGAATKDQAEHHVTQCGQLLLYHQLPSDQLNTTDAPLMGAYGTCIDGCRHYRISALNATCHDYTETLYRMPIDQHPYFSSLHALSKHYNANRRCDFQSQSSMEEDSALTPFVNNYGYTEVPLRTKPLLKISHSDLSDCSTCSEPEEMCGQ